MEMDVFKNKQNCTIELLCTYYSCHIKIFCALKGIVWFESARPVTMTINSDIKLAFDCSGDKKLKL